MNRRLFRNALVLGLVSAIGPFAIDMYLPALPTIGRSLGASLAEVQLSLSAFIVASSISQLFYGPLSDIIGRKTPIYFGLVLFGLGSIGCALSPNIGVLIGFRAVQGVGACAGMVVPRAIVRDLHTGPEAVRLMSLLMLVFSVSPILAPLCGSLVVAGAGWRAVFWVVAFAAVLGLLLAYTQLNETRPPAQRRGSTWSSAFLGYGRLLADRHFVGLAAIGGLGFSAFLIYLSNSSFVLINHYGLSPTVYSVFFALNAAAFIGASQFNHWLTGRFGLRAVIRASVAGFALVMLALLCIMSSGIDRLGLLAGFLFAGFSCLGLLVPNVTVLSLEDHGAIAGTASALLGAVQMLIGAAVMALAGLFADGRPLPMVGGIAACAGGAYLLTKRVLRPVAVAA
jgi:DHA1 family bicyclomycin/chloramphenicol resistance-like MFS transporter